MFDYESDDPNSGPAPQPTSPGADGALYDAVAGMYQSLLGRAGTPDEINQWITGQNGDVNKIQFGIFNSPEAQAFLSRNAGTHNDDPIDTGGDGGGYVPPPPAPTTPAPGYIDPGTYTPPPAFKYADFQDPTPDDMLADPGYKFRLEQGTKALEHSAAARGVLNTGGTLRDVAQFGQDLGNQEYGDVYNRKLNQYAMNRGNALQTYNTNYGTQYTDPWNMNFQAGQAKNAWNFNDWVTSFNQKRSNKLDAFDMGYKTVGLF